jgi:glycerol kinase
LKPFLTAKSEVLAHMPANLPTYEEELWIVLAVEQSTNWFNVALYAMDAIGVVISIQDTVEDPRVEEANQMDALKNTLEHLIASQKQIHHIVVYGDDAKNEAVHRLLATILDANLVRNVRISTSSYDGLAFVAQNAHTHMDTVEFEMRAPSSFGCQWRSRLYKEDQTEL